VRISLGWNTQPEHIEHFATVWRKLKARLLPKPAQAAISSAAPGRHPAFMGATETYLE
jgi:hypothetical protein